MRRHIFLSILTASIALAASAAPQKNSTVLDLKTSITDSNVVYPETFEANTHKLMEGWYMKNYMAHDDRYSKMKDSNTSDATIKERLAKLPTVIDLPFNSIVRQYIDRYTQQGREQVTVILGLSHYYMPIFEQALEERGLPLELKYLPVIESALDPNAVSKHGAAGLWQFMLVTAKGMGLEVNSLVDERRDPYLSSKIAAQLLSDLYATYGDWSLVIAAYNCGPGAINKAIRRAGGDPNSHDFWSIYNYLTPETRGYVPQFIAANYVMNYYPEHNISPVIPSKPLVTDTIRINDQIHFNQISEVLDIPLEELRVLNPQFRADIIPGTEDHPYTLILPSQQVHAYLMSEDAIKQHDAEKYCRRETAQPGEQYAANANRATTQGNSAALLDQANQTGNDSQAQPQNQTFKAQGNRSVVTHKVQPNESLASIANIYGVTPEEIKSANSLRRNAVRTGQLLKIFVDSNSASVAEPANTSGQTDATSTAQYATQQPAATQSKYQAAAKKTAAKKAAPAVTTHKLQSGDNLSRLAKKYGVTVDAIKKANNMTSDNLRAGESIKIPTKAGAKASSNKKSKKRRR